MNWDTIMCYICGQREQGFSAEVAGLSGQPVAASNGQVSDYTALLYPYAWNGNLPASAGRSAVVTYSFSTAAQPYLADSGFSQGFINSFEAFTDVQKTESRNAINQWGAASGLVFIEVAAGQGSIQFGKFDFQQSSSPGAAGFAALPYVQYTASGGNSLLFNSAILGDVFLNADYADNPAFASDLAHVLLHEIGHAIGLKHPFDGTTTLVSSLDNGSQTVMSYTGVRSANLGPLDIQAAQYLYGLNSADASHLSSYSYNPETMVVTLIGTTSANQIFGGYEANAINGGDGNDTLAGFEGNDTIIGGSGDDLIFGGDGNDTLIGGLGNDTLIGSNGYLENQPWSDTVDYGDMTADITINLLRQSSTDGVAYNASSSQIGLDLLKDIDVILTGSGNDSITLGFNSMVVRSGDGDDNIVGITFVNRSLNHSLFGQGGNDTIRGGNGNDTIDGGEGDDTIDGGTGADSMDGGDGIDTLSYASATSGAGILFYMLAANLNGGDAAGDIYTNMENLIGTTTNDRIYMDNGDNRVEGGGGAFDTAELYAGNDTYLGGSGFDYVLAGAGNDVISVGGGGSLIYGEGDDDSITADSGSNEFYGGDGNDTLTGGSGQDVIFGGAGLDSILGGSGDDFLFGEAGNDTISGDDGNDLIQGGSGLDSLFGNAGVDVILGGADADFIDGGSQDDFLFGEAGNDTVLGGTGNDQVFGGDGDDSLVGGDGIDILNGGDGNDTLNDQGTGEITFSIGGNGNDTIIGTSGQDQMWGGTGTIDTGADVFQFGANNGFDIIFDFQAGPGVVDQIWLIGTGIASFAQLQSENRIGQAGANTQINLPGDGNVIFLINTTATTLVADDFLFG